MRKYMASTAGRPVMSGRPVNNSGSVGGAPGRVRFAPRVSGPVFPVTVRSLASGEVLRTEGAGTVRQRVRKAGSDAVTYDAGASNVIRMGEFDS